MVAIRIGFIPIIIRPELRMAAPKFNKRNVIKWLFAVTAIILVLVVVLILTVRSLEPDPPFQFLHDRKPVLQEKFNSFTISIYSFPAAMEEVCAEASDELASHSK